MRNRAVTTSRDRAAVGRNDADRTIINVTHDAEAARHLNATVSIFQNDWGGGVEDPKHRE